MKVLTKIKKLIMVLSAVIVAAILFVTTPVAHAATPINTDVHKYIYEKDDIYYSDGYFAHPATEYDPHLATLSVLMAQFSMNPWGPDSLSDTNWFKNQSNRVKGFFEKIGFENFEANEDYKTKTGFDTIGVGCAKKTVGDYTVIGVTVRSGGYYSEWANNVYLGDGSKSDYMHEGWYNAANKLIKFVNSYVESQNINGKLKLWMAGYSRGGAVTNLAAGLIDNQLGDIKKIFPNKPVTLDHNDVYAYTFETPQGANINSKTVKAPGDAIYNNIWNIINPNDLVTKVAMSAWGFTRFGTDKFITTKFYDSANFSANRETFKKIYASQQIEDADKYSADNFTMKGITGDKYAGLIAGTIAGGPVGAALTGYIMEKVSGIVTDDKTKANYDANIVTSMLLDELCAAIGSRKKYCDTYQSAVKDVMLVAMAETKEDELTRLGRLLMSVMLESSLRYYGLKKTGLVQKLFPEFGDTNLGNIIDFAGLLISVYKERPNEIISTIANISDMFQNHDTWVGVNHVKCQDSYYIDAYNDTHSDKIKLVALRDNAAIVHMSFFGYNDAKVTVGQTKVLDIEGYVLGKSDVKKCDQGYACGYYSYITEEKMELYLPVNESLKVSFKSYSKKLRHEVSYQTFCQYITATTKKQNLPKGSEKVWFNSDRMNITILVQP